MELQPIGSGPTEIFQLDLPFGRPAASSLLYSLCVHASLFVAMLTVSLPQPTQAEIPVAPLQPTELRLDGHLYYVSKIPASAGEGRKQESRTAPRANPTLPQAAESGRMPAPSPEIELPKPPKIVVKSAAPALPDANTEISATRKLVRRELARTFVPPEVKRDPTATQTLIQPLSPPDLVPKPTPLPSFRISSPQFPNIPKPFFAPGRKTPAPPARVPEVAAPNIPLSANPVIASLRPKLPLPVAAPPPEPTPATAPGPPPAPQGDPISILSLSDHPVPMDKSVVVPAGNIAQESGEAQASQAGTAVAASSAGSNAGTRISPTPSNANTTSSTPTPRAAPASSPASATKSSTKSAPRAAAASNAPGSGSAASGRETTVATNAASPVLTLIPPVTDSDPGNGQGSVGSGTGSALAGGSATGDTSAVAGSTKPLSANGSGPAAGNAGKIDAGKGGGAGTGTGIGTGSGNGRAAGGQVINKPRGGTYDAVVIQSSPVDQYPETRGLLSGRPIYSVYVSAGTAKDWTLYFCIPNAKETESAGPVVTIGAPETPVHAPYAYKLVRPDVKLPSYERYVLVHGFISPEGHFQNIHIVRAILPEIDAAILASMADWEFRAATKDGAPIQVEFLLSIPAKGL